MQPSLTHLNPAIILSKIKKGNINKKFAYFLAFSKIFFKYVGAPLPSLCELKRKSFQSSYKSAKSKNDEKQS